MAWLTSYGAANKIPLSEITITISVHDLSTLTTRYRDDTQTEYEYVGMDESTANSCRAALDNPSATPPVYAQKQKENDAGAWKVHVTTYTTGTWYP